MNAKIDPVVHAVMPSHEDHSCILCHVHLFSDLVSEHHGHSLVQVIFVMSIVNGHSVHLPIVMQLLSHCLCLRQQIPVRVSMILAKLGLICGHEHRGLLSGANLL